VARSGSLNAVHCARRGGGGDDDDGGDGDDDGCGCDSGGCGGDDDDNNDNNNNNVFAAAAFNRTITWVASPLSRVCLPFHTSGYGIMGAMAAGDAFQETLTLPAMCPQLREQGSFAPDGWKAGRNNW